MGYTTLLVDVRETVTSLASKDSGVLEVTPTDWQNEARSTPFERWTREIEALIAGRTGRRVAIRLVRSQLAPMSLTLPVGWRR